MACHVYQSASGTWVYIVADGDDYTAVGLRDSRLAAISAANHRAISHGRRRA